MRDFLPAIVAMLAMFAQDIVGTIMTQYESASLNAPIRPGLRGWIGGGWRGWMAAIGDQLQWMVGITSTTISVEAFSGHNFALKAMVFVLVSVANVLGTKFGQEAGRRMLVKRHASTPVTLEDRVRQLEVRLGVKGHL